MAGNVADMWVRIIFMAKKPFNLPACSVFITLGWCLWDIGLKVQRVYVACGRLA